MAEHQVALWLPETDGPYDSDDPGHRALVLLLGAQSAAGLAGPGRTVDQWNPPSEWVTSRKQTHEPLVSEAEFRQTQRISAMPVARDGAQRVYQFVGLIRCGHCARSLHSHWVHGRPGYRCRHGHTSARPVRSNHPRTIYVREDQLTDKIINLLAERHDEPDVTDQRQIACYLREHHLVITYDGANLTNDSSGANPNTTGAVPGMTLGNPWGLTCRRPTRPIALPLSALFVELVLPK